jgi:hypothetical protein
LWGKLFGDRGYISQPWLERWQGAGVPLITKLKRRMKNKRMPLLGKVLWRKRMLIESVGEPLKHVCQISHTRHRSVNHAFVHILAALVAYTWYERKPTLHFTEQERDLLAQAF